MRWVLRYSVGAATVGEGLVAYLPRCWSAGAPLVACCHGATGNATNVYDAAYETIPSVARALAGVGYAVVCADLGGDTWGNATMRSRLDDLYGYVTGTLGCATPIGIYGGSMGGCALSWVAANRSKVAAFAGVEPVSDINDIYTNNRQNLGSSINAAYGGAWSQATYGVTCNPITLAQGGSFSGMPYKAWYGDSDTTVIPSTVTGLISAIGGTASGVVVTGGTHATTTGLTPAADVASFFRAYLG